MEKRLGSVVSMASTGQKGSPGEIEMTHHLVLNKFKIPVSSEEDIVEKGYQPHFS